MIVVKKSHSVGKKPSCLTSDCVTIKKIEKDNDDDDDGDDVMMMMIIIIIIDSLKYTINYSKCSWCPVVLH